MTGMSASDQPGPTPPPAPDRAPVDLVRRRLLQAGGYAVPAVLAVLVLEGPALAQASCTPNQCQPANPLCDPTTNCTPFRTKK